jgi:spoIIIJ-associated protein
MDNQPLTQEELTTGQQAIDELFKVLEVSGTADIIAKDDALDVLLETEDTGIVIGYHGEVLESLQLISSLVVSKKIGRFVRVFIEVGDYKKNRTAYLENLTRQMKDRALTENREQMLPSLKSWERRVVHMLLQDDDEVTSESVGEGRERTLVIKPKNS